MKTKNKIIISVVFMFLGCKINRATYYHGYIYNTEGKPIAGLILEGRDHNGFKSISNSDGYFKITMRDSWIEEYIYVYDKNRKLDSIQVIRTNRGEKLTYTFVEGRNDTLFIDMNKLKLK